MANSVLVLVMTDVAGSTRLWEQHPAAMNVVMARHHEIVHTAVAEFGGWRPVDQGEGDAVFAAFESPSAATRAVAKFQRTLAAEQWPAGIDLRVRVGVHMGEVTVRDGNLFGSTVNRAARLRGLGAGGQVLLSAPVFELVRDQLPDGLALADLGEHRMKDLTRPEHVYQLRGPGMLADFPPLASLDRAANNLPIQSSTFFGREAEVAELTELLTDRRLVTVLGFGGMGKTRLALQVAAELADGDGDGVWFVDLSTITDASLIPSVIASAIGASGSGTDALAELVAALATQRLLLVLDNLEQLMPHAADTIARILAGAPEVRMLVTSREALRLREEHVFTLAPLPLPPARDARSAWEEHELAQLSTYAAVAMFLSRAGSVRRDFSLTASNAAAVAAICARLDGLPLALELAAARLRALSPEQLLPRLENALKVLTGGSRDLPTRQQTLRATIAWSFESLTEAQQRLLVRLSVFTGTFTMDAAEAVVADDPSDQGGGDLDVLDGITDLVDRSLVRHHPAVDSASDDRYSLLVPIREYAAELHEADAAFIMRRRHAAYYTELISLPAGWSKQDQQHRDALVLAEWHNIRTTFSAQHELGDHEGEMRIAIAIVSALRFAGRMGEAGVVISHAIQHLPEPPTATLHVRVVLSQAVVDREARRVPEARFWTIRAIAMARTLGDLSLLVVALSDASVYADTMSTAHAMLAEAEALLRDLPAGDSSIPEWYARDRWAEAVVEEWDYDPAAAEAIQRDRVAAATGAERVQQEYTLAVLLNERGDFDGAIALLQQFEREGSAPEADPFVRLWGPHVAGMVRTMRDEFEQAESDLDRAEQLLTTFDSPSPDWRMIIDIARAVLARRRGTPDVAFRLLRQVEAASSARLNPIECWGMIVLAVLHRERGEHAEAATLLDRVWAFSAENADMHDILSCLFERAAQVIDADPDAALHALAVALAHQRGRVQLNGVDYPIDSYFAQLRQVLGDAVVDDVLARAPSMPMPVPPSWT